MRGDNVRAAGEQGAGDRPWWSRHRAEAAFDQMSTVMMRFVRVLLSAVVMTTVAAVSSAFEQSPAPAAQAQPAPAGVPPSSGPAQPAKPAEAAGPFTFNPEGRRDPFISLIGKGSDPKNAGARP